MENKKFDFNSLIGFLLIGGIILYLLSTNQDEEAKKVEDTKANQESVQQPADSSTATKDVSAQQPAKDTQVDSAAMASKNEKLGAFGYSAGLPSAKDETTTLENNVLKLKVSNKGGQIVEAKLKNLKTYDSLPVYLIKDKNATLNISFATADHKQLDTKDLYFEPTLSENGENTSLSMKLKVSADQYLEYTYTLKPNDYMMDFTVNSRGLRDVINQTKPVNLDWKLKGYRHSKSVSYENRYTETNWLYEGDKTSSQSASGEDEDKDKDISWVAYRQHFFTSILLTDSPFEKGAFQTKNLVDDDEKDTIFTKSFASHFPLKLKGGEVSESMNLYYGPTDYKVLNSYDRQLDEVVPLGWGIFGWINRYAIMPFFSFLMSFLPAGLAIIFLTVSVKILLSPVQYKQFLSQAKMKVLRPETEAINEKYKDNSMKRQQETMKLNRKAGINPASGCLVGLIQLPVFYAMFTFFPSAFDLRHKSFLWATDLSSYDVVAHLPFTIPFYGDHVSLFPILAAVAIFFYMTLTTGQSMQKQPGMPNMKFIMYLSPLLMLFFFNTYASGLSLYYFTSNLISIGIVLVIKAYIIDEDKIHAKIEEKKKKPKKQNRFQRKMSEMMEEAEKQKNAKK